MCAICDTETTQTPKEYHFVPLCPVYGKAHRYSVVVEWSNEWSPHLNIKDVATLIKNGMQPNLRKARRISCPCGLPEAEISR